MTTDELTEARSEQLYRSALRHADEHEARDLHDADAALEEALSGLSSGDPHPDFQRAMAAPLGAAVPGGGKKLKEVRGMGAVYDWRTSPWTPANGGRIVPQVFVHHIPVVRNVPGLGDFVTLRNVLVAQGLMVQSSTDREGNVGLFTPFNVLCFQARGANQVSCGCEHMHFSTSEAWSDRQMWAAAWTVNLALKKHRLPATVRARLGSGAGVVRILRKGQTTHEAEADAAGFHDRSDPGPRFDFEKLSHGVHYFRAHGHFAGA